MLLRRSPVFAVPYLILATLLSASAAAAAENPKDCCKIIRVDTEKRTVWLRNPRSGQVAQFRVGAADTTSFAVGDGFNPDTNMHNGTKLEHRYAMTLPELDAPNAHLIRARGAEMAGEVDATKTVYRFYALKFGNVLSSVKPGQPIYIDEAAGWAFIRVEGYGKVKPSVFAFKLD